MTDPTEEVRRSLQEMVNSGEIQPEGQTWTTEGLRKEFEVLGFLAPFVRVRRKSDGVMGMMMFRHAPRVYFDFEPTVNWEEGG
jgi:hypothetical protein